MEWIKIDDRLPQKPETPYKSYFVWLRGVKGKEKHGVASVAQFSRDKNEFVLNRYDCHLIITRWAKIEPPSRE